MGERRRSEGAPAEADHGGNPPGGHPEIDTVRWALGSVRTCACSDCWERRELWRQVRIVLRALDEARPGALPVEVAHYLWDALSAPRWRVRRRRAPRPAPRAIRWLRAHAAREGWNVGQLYEVVLRGVARRR
ncbi:MAG TPA: hypothetical protein VLU43_04460 [Anaeromyxobacteraceae bacterium]|nr:hypothetical protein [Anaeromyxobacteraceae bacterium]